MLHLPANFFSSRTVPVVLLVLTTIHWMSLCAQTTSSAPYCPATHTGCGVAEVGGVGLNTLTNTEACTNPYMYYNNAGNNTTTVQPGTTYSFIVSMGVGGTYSSAVIAVWIDYNRNNAFEASEWFQAGSSISSYSYVSVTIPSSASLGVSRMRVRSRAFGNPIASTDPCTSFANGTTKDFDITIGTFPLPPVLGPLPSISSLSPMKGPAGTIDTITGNNFSLIPGNNIVNYGSIRRRIFPRDHRRY
jgi:hypothetical protein